MTATSGTGGPAFPPDPDSIRLDTPQGMTLRDYFAAKAIVGMLASSIGDNYWGSPSEAAETAYVYADAMLQQRMKPQ